MGKGKKDEKKTIVNTKQPKSGKVEKASAKDKKGPSKKGVEKVAQIVKSKAPSKDVKVVAKSVPPKKKEEPKKQQKKESSSESESSSASSSSSEEQSSSSVSASGSGSSSSDSGSSSSASGSDSASGSSSSASGSGSGSSSSGSESESGSSSSASGSESSGSGDSDESSSSSSEKEKEKEKEKEEKKQEKKKDEKKDDKKRKSDNSAAAPPAKKQKTEGDNKVFIDNLVFSITDEDVHKFFKDCGKIASIEWVEANGRFAGKGTVTFDSSESAQKAVGKSGTDLMGRRVKVTIPGAVAFGEPNTTIVVGNLAYDITEEEVTAALEGAGEIIQIRFPQKGGCAFVEYGSLEESAAALAKLAGVELRGRPVYPDYARARGDSRPSTPGRGGQGGRGGFQGGARGNTGPKTPKPEGGCTLFIGGLPQDVDEAKMKASFEGCNIANIRWLERDGEFKGVGFVEFVDTKTADKAMEKATAGLNIGGRWIRADWAGDKKKF